jgi:hypothetical protein
MMKKLFLTLFIIFTCISSFAQETDWIKYLNGIKDAINAGSFDAGNFDLFSMYDLGGLGLDNLMNEIIGDRGAGAFGQGGIFNQGGINLGSLLGMDEIHNDASLNSNITWGILHTKYLIHPRINERQEKVIAIQDSINQRVKRLYELEKLTLDYLSTKQPDAVEIEDKMYMAFIAGEILGYLNMCNQLINSTTGLEYMKVRLNTIVLIRAERIATKLAAFALVDGNSNLLNNEDRNSIITDVIEMLRELRSTCAHTYKELVAAAHYNTFENLIKTSGK